MKESGLTATEPRVAGNAKGSGHQRAGGGHNILTLLSKGQHPPNHLLGTPTQRLIVSQSFFLLTH